jgi:glutaredoxin
MSDIIFTDEKGNKDKGDIKVFALSTCAFCKKALNFLRENSISFSYIYIDDLDPEIKQNVKKDLHDKYKKEVAFPFLVLNGEVVIVGFKENEYKKYLL